MFLSSAHNENLRSRRNAGSKEGAADPDAYVTGQAVQAEAGIHERRRPVDTPGNPFGGHHSVHGGHRAGPSLLPPLPPQLHSVPYPAANYYYGPAISVPGAYPGMYTPGYHWYPPAGSTTRVANSAWGPLLTIPLAAGITAAAHLHPPAHMQMGAGTTPSHDLGYAPRHENPRLGRSPLPIPVPIPGSRHGSNTSSTVSAAPNTFAPRHQGQSGPPPQPMAEPVVILAPSKSLDRPTMLPPRTTPTVNPTMSSPNRRMRELILSLQGTLLKSIKSDVTQAKSVEPWDPRARPLMRSLEDLVANMDQYLERRDRSIANGLIEEEFDANFIPWMELGRTQAENAYTRLSFDRVTEESILQQVPLCDIPPHLPMGAAAPLTQPAPRVRVHTTAAGAPRNNPISIAPASRATGYNPFGQYPRAAAEPQAPTYPPVNPPHAYTRPYPGAMPEAYPVYSTAMPMPHWTVPVPQYLHYPYAAGGTHATHPQQWAHASGPNLPAGPWPSYPPGAGGCPPPPEASISMAAPQNAAPITTTHIHAAGEPSAVHEYERVVGQTLGETGSRGTLDRILSLINTILVHPSLVDTSEKPPVVKSGAKVSAPDKYNGHSDAVQFETWTIVWLRWCALHNLHVDNAPGDSSCVLLLSQSLEGNALRFFNDRYQEVAWNGWRYAYREVITDLYDRFMTKEPENEAIDKYKAFEQGGKDIRTYLEELVRLAKQQPAMPKDFDFKLKLFRGMSSRLRCHLTHTKGLNPTTATLVKIVTAAQAHERAISYNYGKKSKKADAPSSPPANKKSKLRAYQKDEDDKAAPWARRDPPHSQPQAAAGTSKPQQNCAHPGVLTKMELADACRNCGHTGHYQMVCSLPWQHYPF